MPKIQGKNHPKVEPYPVISSPSSDSTESSLYDEATEVKAAKVASSSLQRSSRRGRPIKGTTRNDLIKQLSQAQRELTNLRKTCADQATSITTKQVTIVELEARVRRAEAEAQELMIRANSLIQQSEQVNIQLNRAGAQLSEMQSNNAALLVNKAAEIDALKGSINKYQNAFAKIGPALQDKVVKIGLLEERNAELQKEVESTRATILLFQQTPPMAERFDFLAANMTVGSLSTVPSFDPSVFDAV